MCDVASLALTALASLGTYRMQKKIDNKDKIKNQAQIKDAQQNAKLQAEEKNLLLNSVQTTEETKPTLKLKQPLKTQTPTMNTGSQSSVGLNLGGY